MITDGEHLGRVVDVCPRQLGDVDEPVDALQVDEGTEVDDVGDDTLDDRAGLQVVQYLLTHLAPLVLDDRPTGEHDVVAAAVELDDLALQVLPHELVQVLHAADVDQRRRKESADAEVDDQAALDDFDHPTGHHLAVVRRLFDPLPRTLEPRTLLGEDQPPVLILLLQHQCIDQLAELDLIRGVDALSDRELVGRDDALALVPDVDQDLVLVDPNHLPADDVALLERRKREVVVGNHLPIDFDVLRAVKGVDSGVGVGLHSGVFLVWCAGLIGPRAVGQSSLSGDAIRCHRIARSDDRGELLEDATIEAPGA